MRVFKNRLYLITLIIIIVVTAGIWFSFTSIHQEEEEKNSEEQVNQEKERGQQARFQDAEFTVYNNDKTIRWELDTSKLLHREKENLMQMMPVNARAFSDDDNKQIYSLKGTEGFYRGAEGRFKIEGPVNLEKDEYVLKAGKLIWYQERDMITGSDNLEISTSEIILTGDKFEADTALTTFTVYGNSRQAKLIWRENEDEKDPE